MKAQHNNHYLVARLLGGAILAIVLVILALILGNAFYHKTAPQTAGAVTSQQTNQAQEQAAVKKRSADAEKPPLPPLKQKAKYSFYEQLQRRSREVQAEVAQRTAAQKNRPPIKGRNYRIQIGAFRDKEQAEQLRTRIILRGMPVEIIRSKSYYLVQIGPYADKSSALTIQKKLERENMDTILKTFVDD